MRKVFSNNSEVCHIWAQRTQKEGRANNIFFEGDRIFSYGHHFEIARFVDLPDENIVLFTTRGYSNSTAKHLNHVRCSISHYDVLNIPNFDNHDENLKYFKNTLTDLLKSFINSRKYKELRQDQIKDLMGDIETWLKYFGNLCKDKKLLKILKSDLASFKNNTLFSEEQQQKFKESIKIERQLKTEETKRRKEELKGDLKKWQDGEDVRANFNILPVALRVKDEEVETTKGARVPIKEALNLCDLIAKKENVEGFKIGYYTVNRVTEKNLIAGCHTIPLEEVKRIHALLK